MEKKEVLHKSKTLRIRKLVVAIISVILMLILVSTTSFAVSEKEKNDKLETMNISASSYAVMSASTSEMVIDGRADRKMQPGRIATLVNAMVVIDNMYNEEELENSVDIDKDLAEYGETFREGETVTIRDLLTAMLVGGDGQAAEALASYSASKRDVFIREMNSKCMQLGLMDTYFSNPKGSYSTKTYSTAADCAVIMQAAIRYELIKKTFELKGASVNAVSKEGNRTVKILSSNPLLTGEGGDSPYKDGRGGISGSLDEPTPASQYAGVAVKDDMQFVVVLMDADRQRIYSDARNLLDYASSIATRNVVVEGGKVAGHVMIKGGDKIRVPAYTEQKGFAYVPPEGSEELVETETFLQHGLSAPLKKGDKVGEFRIFVAGELKGTVDLVVNEDIGKGWPPSQIYISNTASIVIGVILFLMLLLLLRILYVRRRRAKRKARRHREMVREMALKQMEIDEDRRRRNWTYGQGYYDKLPPRTMDIRKEKDVHH